MSGRSTASLYKGTACLKGQVGRPCRHVGTKNVETMLGTKGYEVGVGMAREVGKPEAMHGYLS